MKVLFRSYELDTANIIIGNYIKEDGFYMEDGIPICGKPCTRHYIQDEDCIKHEIAPDYLSINFEDMIDSEGTKIFASLRERGKGGDIIAGTLDGDSYYDYVGSLYFSSNFMISILGVWYNVDREKNKFELAECQEKGKLLLSKLWNLKVTGIQQ